VNLTESMQGGTTKFFFFGGAMWHGNAWHGYVRLTTLAWCVGVYMLHPTGGGMHLGKCFIHASANADQCGTGTEQAGAVALSVSPRRACRCLTPGCLHQSRWRSSLFVEHFAQVLHAFLVFGVFLSYRYSLVSRQSICILSLIFLYHRFLTASSVW